MKQEWIDEDEVVMAKRHFFGFGFVCALAGFALCLFVSFLGLCK